MLRLGDALGELPLMDLHAAIVALGALAQEHRLALFRLLVQAGAFRAASLACVPRIALSLPTASFGWSCVACAALGWSSERARGATAPGRTSV